MGHEPHVRIEPSSAEGLQPVWQRVPAPLQLPTDPGAQDLVGDQHLDGGQRGGRLGVWGPDERLDWVVETGPLLALSERVAVCEDR
jgi:hypothetical protein